MHKRRLPLMALTFLALLVGMWAGLVRLGWNLPTLRPTWPVAHGPLMVGGFLGTLISLERAVALNRPPAYVAPVLSALGALALLVGLPLQVAALFLTLGSAGLVLVSVEIVRRQPALFTLTLGLGALAWLVGNLLWALGWPLPALVGWWGAFLVLTIVGERLELSRLLRLSAWGQRAFALAVGLYVLGLALSVVDINVGVRVTGAGQLALAAWLARYDIARRTVRQVGLTRFIALCLLLGYAWLAVAGVLGVWYGGVTSGPGYDAVLHAVFLGFVFSMIFGHAPIIFPAVTGIPMTFSPRFYLHLALLHFSVLVRVVGGAVNVASWRQLGGLLNALAIVLFLANTVMAVRATRRLSSQGANRGQSAEGVSR